MASKKNFTTIFPYCENSHLIKDIGQIPYFMQQLHNYEACLVSYKISNHYSHLEGEVKGLRIHFIDNIGKFLFAEKAVLKYLFKNAGKIDVLNLYHFTKHTFIYGIVYKLLNPKGVLYIKLDAYNESFKKEIVHSKQKIKNLFFKRVENIFLKKTDLFSIENTEGEKLFKLKYPRVSAKTIYLPNGVNDLFLKEHFKKIKEYHQKENIIITTGRIGLPIKNHEMILKALALADLKRWKMYFIGPVQPEFLVSFNQLCNDFPKLKASVFFTGEILNRKELYEWYNKAKFFCLTSPFESFGISLVEASYFGNYILGTEGISSFKDVTNNGKFGKALKLNNYEGFAKELERLIRDKEIMASCFKDIVEYNHRNFLWSEITIQLSKQIKRSSDF